MLKDSPSFYLPNLYTFQNGNTFLGSFQGLRFRVKPETQGEGDEAVPILTALVWYGEYCLERSEIQAQAVFPQTAEGREALLDWLDGEYTRFQVENGQK